MSRRSKKIYGSNFFFCWHFVRAHKKQKTVTEFLFWEEKRGANIEEVNEYA